MANNIKNYVKQKAKKAVKKWVLGLFMPFLPVAFICLLSFTFALILSTAIYGQLTGGQTLVSGAAYTPTGEDKEIKEYIIKKTDEINVEETWVENINLKSFADPYGRDRALALTWGNIYTAAMLENTIYESEINKEIINAIAEKFKPTFIYTPAKKVVEKLVEKEVEEEDENGNKVKRTIKEWETIMDTKEYLLVRADTIFGNYEYTYEQVTETKGNTKITYMKPKETKLVGKPNERLEKFLLEDLKVQQYDIDTQIRMFMEASAGFVEERERMEWLTTVGSMMYNYVSYLTIPPDIMPVVKEIAEKYNMPIWFISAVIQKESSFNPMAVNDKTGALGLMQVMPSNWEYYAPQLGYDPVKDKYNPKAQLDVGTYLLKSYIGDVDFDSPLWKEETLPGLAKYGGFSDIERARQEYAEKIWIMAENFKVSFSGSAVWPVPGYYGISSNFGIRIHPIWKTVSMHEGIDIPCPIGTNAVAVANGQVIYSGWIDGYGNTVVIRDMTHDYLYGHLNSIFVKTGDAVKVGQVIALTGNTGDSTGPHLHFGVTAGDFRNGKWIDPVMILQK